jgi:hypothetical protein
MIIFVYFFPNASGLPCAKNLRKWAEKAFVSSTLVFHAQTMTTTRHDDKQQRKITQIVQINSREDTVHAGWIYIRLSAYGYLKYLYLVQRMFPKRPRCIVYVLLEAALGFFRISFSFLLYIDKSKIML